MSRVVESVPSKCSHTAMLSDPEKKLRTILSNRKWYSFSTDYVARKIYSSSDVEMKNNVYVLAGELFCESPPNPLL